MTPTDRHDVDPLGIAGIAHAGGRDLAVLDEQAVGVLRLDAVPPGVMDVHPAERDSGLRSLRIVELDAVVPAPCSSKSSIVTRLRTPRQRS